MTSHDITQSRVYMISAEQTVLSVTVSDPAQLLCCCSHCDVMFKMNEEPEHEQNMFQVAATNLQNNTN